MKSLNPLPDPTLVQEALVSTEWTTMEYAGWRMEELAQLSVGSIRHLQDAGRSGPSVARAANTSSLDISLLLSVPISNFMWKSDVFLSSFLFVHVYVCKS